ncbi:MAG TPA: hypothetical protein VF704_03570 [Allosphingosinicella sp.]|jgi:hypothetical protein
MSDSRRPVPESEAAAVRRRWITLAEILAVVAVVISALTLWNNYQQRTGEVAEKEAAKREAASEAQTLLLRARPDRAGRRLTLAPADAEQTIQNQTIAFPPALEAAQVETVADARIDAGWFERKVLRALSRQQGADDRRGDRRLPVAIVTTFYRGGTLHRDAALYDIGYRVTGGGLLSDRDIRLLGLSRIESVDPRRARARLDALWRSRAPAAER